jgi:hypothetical protein
MNAIRSSDELIEATINGESEKVAEMVDILISDFRGDRIDRHVRKKQQIFCFAQPVIDQIVDGRDPEGLEKAADYINPLPHGLMLTAIVVSLGTTAVGLSLLLRMREKYGTIEEDDLLMRQELLSMEERDRRKQELQRIDT